MAGHNLIDHAQWEFFNPNTTRPSIIVELRESSNYLNARSGIVQNLPIHYYGDLSRDRSLDLALTVLNKLTPTPFAVNSHVRVVKGPMCGVDGFVEGHLRENGTVVLRCTKGILLVSPEFIRAT